MKHVSKRCSIFRNSPKKSTSSANFVYVAFRPMLMVGIFSIQKSPPLHNNTLCGKGDFGRGATLILYSSRSFWRKGGITSITGEPVFHFGRSASPAPAPREIKNLTLCANSELATNTDL